ncbi:hypothetical protein LHP98_13920 [Rhodobacter sp. Har01]|uniref:hypothetical protein n=1 Tax=Rhodobacter sp. Har01 TaxID=2883999 RepID=UPI001D0776E2|nr:hypothetical protein [Rhodobacter sp. Har01]MCB6179219.1 hypothetical protein [Rhodobacter sp. Har01]
MSILLAWAAVFAALFVIPILVYGAASALTGIQPPGGDPRAFLTGVAVSKAGTALAFVGLWLVARDAPGFSPLIYVALWWGMFVIGEVGQALGPDYSRTEAIAGGISETLYLPLAGWILTRLLPV